MPISTYDANTITEVPVASPSRPSVRFTPLEVPAIMTYAQMTNRTLPRTTPVSRMNEISVDAGVSPFGSGNCSASTANETATIIWPASLAQARSPRLRCLAILM